MSVTETATIVDRFVRFLETGDPGDVMAPDVFADFNVPHWRWQLQGAEALASHYRHSSPNGARVTIGRCLPTPSGFVLESESRHDDDNGEEILYRSAYLVVTNDEKITEIVEYCSGEWDEATRVRQAAEAPMIRRG